MMWVGLTALRAVALYLVTMFSNLRAIFPKCAWIEDSNP